MRKGKAPPPPAEDLWLEYLDSTPEELISFLGHSPWTLFWDMHSGGSVKEVPYDEIYIQAPEEEAKVIFYNKFGHNPERVSCTCCGEDYSLNSAPSLAQLSAYHRKCAYAYVKVSTGEVVSSAEGWERGKGLKEGYWSGYIEAPDTSYNSSTKLISLKEYVKGEDVLIIREKDILPEWRVGSVPEQGYVWRD